MRKMKTALLGSLLFCAATAVWAADPAPAAAPVPSETVAAAPAATPAPALPADLFTPAAQSKLVIPCPPEPIVQCESCFYFGTYLAYQCTTYCVNGAPRRSCTSCGSGCPL